MERRLPHPRPGAASVNGRRATCKNVHVPRSGMRVRGVNLLIAKPCCGISLVCHSVAE